MFDGLRRLFSRLGKGGTTIVGLALWEIGARVGLLGLDPVRLAKWLGNNENPLLWLYGILTGGAFTRGALLGLGIAPYLSARIMVRLSRFVSPELEAMAAHRDGRAKLSEWARRLTVGLSMIQGVGFARFVQRVGAAPQGAGFIAQTVIALTAGSVFVMLVSEQLSGQSDREFEEAQAEDADAIGESETFAQALTAGPAVEVEAKQRQPIVTTRDRS